METLKNASLPNYTLKLNTEKINDSWIYYICLNGTTLSYATDIPAAFSAFDTAWKVIEYMWEDM